MKAKDIARKLKEIRVSQGLTQADIAEAINLSVSQVSRIEAGQRGLAIDRLGPWARALGYSTELVMWAPSPNEEQIIDTLADELSEEQVAALHKVAAAFPRLPSRGRAALLQVFEELDASEPPDGLELETA